jgi:plastocyanin
MIKNIKNFTVGNRLFHCAFCGLTIAVFSWSFPVFGVDASINIINYAFTPDTVNISVNNTVTWNWVGSPHTTTSDTGLWDSGVFGIGHTFSQKFTSAGSFPFHCEVHPFMIGTIVVQATKVPPAVAFANPRSGSVFAAPASFPLTVTASDTTASVTNVQFFQGSTPLGNAAASPYSVSVRNLAAGTYTFSAIAMDNAGSIGTNEVTLSVAAPAPIRLSAVQQLSSTRFQFGYSATIGLSYVVQRSLDLTHWTALSTNTAAANSIVFTDQNASGNRWLYRVGLLPNP